MMALKIILPNNFPIYRQNFVRSHRKHATLLPRQMSTTPDAKSAQTPNPKTISSDMVGPPDPVSNLRTIVFKQPAKETKLEKKFREMRGEVQEWNHNFWTQHNSKFIQELYGRMDKLKQMDLNLIAWKTIKNEGLDLEYGIAFSTQIAKEIFAELEAQVEYFTGDLAKVRVFGKVHPLPRQQVAYGDEGITYKYSGTTVPALSWPEPVLALRNFLFKLKGIKYDFVLVNKYRNGHDHMGEHRDNEPELDHNFPIASISFGQERQFVLKHKDARKQGKNKKTLSPVKITLENGSILFMNPPTNDVWYHSLPTRKKLLGARINLTFRKMRKLL